MTKFSSVFGALLSGRIRRVHQVALTGLIAIVVTTAWTMIPGNFDLANGDLFGIIGGWSFVVYLVLFVEMARFTERAFVSDSIRLMPLNDTKLYLANLTASMVAFLYGVLLQVLLHVVGGLLSWHAFSKTLSEMWVAHPGNYPIWVIVLSILCLMFLVLVMMWTTISLIHLVTTSISLFLPASRQKAVQVILYIFVTFVILYIAQLVFRAPTGTMSALHTTSTGAGPVLINLIWIAVVIVIESLLNVLMLKRWVETSH